MLPHSRIGQGRRFYDWDLAAQRLQDNPFNWVQLVDEPVSQSTGPWCRNEGPVALRALRAETDYRMRDVQDGKGVLYGCWSPGITVVRRKLRSHLTEPEVAALRVAYAGGKSMAEVGGLYGITVGAVWHIVHGRTWKNAGGPLANDNGSEH